VPGGGGVDGGVVGEGEGVGLDAVVCDPPHPARIHTASSNIDAAIFEMVMGPQDQGRLLLEEMLPVGLLLPEKSTWQSVIKIKPNPYR